MSDDTIEPLPEGTVVFHGVPGVPGGVDSYDDADSTLGTDASSSTASISSSILAYRTINGRQYHAERSAGKAWTPNDDRQLEAQELFSHVCFLLMGKKLFLEPLDPNTLNVCTFGTFMLFHY